MRAAWPWLVGCLLLFTATFALYWPVKDHEFVDYDDQVYVTDNARVRAGLTWEGVRWAFGRLTGEHTYWHPLTWLSHMLDCQWFGLDAGAHHRVSVLLHGANAVLLFLLLRSMTGAGWRSGLVAALFAWHPLQVDTVAWVAERKNVLSTFFFLLTLWAYARYGSGAGCQGSGVGLDATRKTRHPSRFYWLALLFFALGLMCKPMLVTVPFVLLLLDLWPLKRIDFHAGMRTLDARFIRCLLCEKLPFLALSVVSAVITFVGHARLEGISTDGLFSLDARLTNALVAYCGYIWKMIWPSDLAVFYPHPGMRPAWQVIGAGVVLAATSVLVVRSSRSRPYLVVGWLWFLGTLVPTIGLVQAGGQSMADRFAYIPLMGLFIALVWGAGDITRRWPSTRSLVGAGGLLALGVCAVLTRMQLGVWANSETLFRHAATVTRDNYVAYANLGFLLYRSGRLTEAVENLRAAVRLRPEFFESLNNLGCALLDQGQPEEAVALLTRAVNANAGFPEAYNNLANALLAQEKVAEAKPYVLEALRLNPGYAKAHYNLGIILVRQGQPDEAAAAYREALRLKPEYPAANNNLGTIFLKQGRSQEAIEHFQAAVRQDPRYAPAYNNLATAYATEGKFADAATYFRLAMECGADPAAGHANLGKASAAQGQPKEAAAHYREALRLRPDFPDALNNLAWLLATCKEAGIRDGAEAVKLAEQAAGLTGHQEAETLDTLAAAYAEAGRFADAIHRAQEALRLAKTADQTDLATKVEKRLESYRSGQPFRE